MSSKNTVFKNINDTLKTVELALNDLKNELPERRVAAIRNVITFGRSVTFALQKLKSHVDHFDDWYLPKQREMINSPLFKYFKDLRDEIIHEGKLDTSVQVRMPFFSPILLEYMPKPPNQTGFFIGDQSGGSGWIVKNENGDEEKFYISLNKNFVDVQLQFSDLPDNLGIEDTSIVNLCSIYYEYLSNLVEEAKEIFK